MIFFGKKTYFFWLVVVGISWSAMSFLLNISWPYIFLLNLILFFIGIFLSLSFQYCKENKMINYSLNSLSHLNVSEKLFSNNMSLDGLISVENSTDKDKSTRLKIKIPRSLKNRNSDMVSVEFIELSEFYLCINSMVQSFFQEVLFVYQKGHTSAYQTAQMNDQMVSMLTVAESVKSAADEAHLLAINTLVESAKQSKYSGNFSDMATYVQGVAIQSNSFSASVYEEVETAKKAIDHIRELMLKVAQRELDSALFAKQNIDFSLGGLHTIDDLFSQRFISSEIKENMISIAEQYFKQLIVGLTLLRDKVEMLTQHDVKSDQRQKQITLLIKDCQRLEKSELIF